jgi:hypothetical protein
VARAQASARANGQDANLQSETPSHRMAAA